ncbi:MAG: hypothetical protein IK080_08100 [Clostridia bacterium]|nr:hypothetical protein [Clostridia bacterium]
MKKILAIILAISFVTVLFAACGKKDSTIHDLGSVDPGSQQATPAEPQVENTTVYQPPVWTPPATLSADYHSGQLQIDGVVYTVPITGADLLKQGWQLQNSWDIGKSYTPNEPEKSISMFNGSTELMVSVVNYSDAPASIEDCYVYGLRVSDTTVGSITTRIGSVVLPGGLSLRSATYEDIISRWGQASSDDIASGGSSTVVHYSVGNYEEDYKYVLDFTGNHVLRSVWLFNENKPAYLPASNPSLSQTEPAVNTPPTSAYEDPASASSASATIDVSALQRIESSDSCPVKITQKQLIDDYYKGQLVNIGETGDDACVFTITNNSGKDIQQVVFLAVGYKQNYDAMKIGGTITFFGNDKYVIQFTTQDTVIKNGSSEKIGVRCDGTDLVGVNAIVYSYTTADGTTYTNDTASQWYQSVYAASKTF